ncbi:hypothetical protein CIB95_01290 [Lottiidibacillus patelloidae]|uniref:Intracellular proteinase inhibitor BsuPI domain-containing protein n=1 Tax=Lottiidibacillus patelloidae TaxID=2670334 RepID=A0A263BWY8_9BACI|nr:BsuPI-related putative proteinase inhibitor [Lottiidibacillus patelloidae]OZM58235.1 hypothetical protein CIB95_01290 [Lottiidibacillus patelloidae]
MIKKVLFSLMLLFVLTSCNTGMNEPINRDGQGTDNPNYDVDLSLQIDAQNEGNVTNFKIILKNEAETDADLEFSSGQQFEIIVKNDRGEQVYQFSEGRVFTQAFQTLNIPAGESVEWLDKWEHDEKIVSGNYEVDVKLLAITVNEETIDPFELIKSNTIVIEKADNAIISDNNAFRNIEVSKSGVNGTIYRVSGEARVFEAVYQYEVIVDGEVVLSKMETVKEGAPTWSPFTIIVDFNEVAKTQGNVVLELFVYSANDGSKENIISIPLQ